MVASDHLRAFIERVERIEEEITALNTDKKDIYAEAKGFGFDVPTIKKVVRLRKLDASEREEADALLDTYLAALGMLPASRAPAHEADAGENTPAGSVEEIGSKAPSAGGSSPAGPSEEIGFDADAGETAPAWTVPA